MGIHRVNFTISDEADKILDALAAEDALGRPNHAATLERLIFEERDRRRRRKARQEPEEPPRRFSRRRALVFGSIKGGTCPARSGRSRSPRATALRTPDRGESKDCGRPAARRAAIPMLAKSFDARTAGALVEGPLFPERIEVIATVSIE